MKTKTQAETQLKQVEAHLKQFGTISSWMAIRHYRITRLAHYIHLMRKEGKDIESKWRTRAGKRFVLYTLKN